MVDRKRSKEVAGRVERGVESRAGTQVEELVERAPRFARLAKSITRGRTKVSDEQRAFLDDFAAEVGKRAEGGEDTR